MRLRTPSLALALAPFASLAGTRSLSAQTVPATSSAPAASDSLSAAVAALARVGAANAPSLAPDGRRVAFITRLSGTPQVWVAPTTSGYPRQVTAFDDPVTGVLWSPDGAWLAVGVAPGGGLNEQIYLLRPDGTALRRITPGGKDNNGLDAWSRDGRTLFLDSNRESPDEIRVYAYDLASGATRAIAGTGGVGGATDATSDGTRLVIFRLKSRGDSDLWLRDLRTGREHRLTPHPHPTHWHLMPLIAGTPVHAEGFTKSTFWVSRYKWWEMLADDLPTYVSPAESVVNRDVVLWYYAGLHHFVRDEDTEMTHLMWVGFMLRPANLWVNTPLYP